MRRADALKAGDTLNRWSVLEVRGALARARCACGTERVVRVARLLSGRSSSCGCLAIERRRAPRPLCRLPLEGTTIRDVDVLRPAENIPASWARAGLTAWTCRCRVCGLELVIKTADLQQAKVRTRGFHCGDAPAAVTPGKATGHANGRALVRVMAHRAGQHAGRVVRVGEVLDVPLALFNPSWLRRVPGDTPCSRPERLGSHPRARLSEPIAPTIPGAHTVDKLEGHASWYDQSEEDS